MGMIGRWPGSGTANTSTSRRMGRSTWSATAVGCASRAPANASRTAPNGVMDFGSDRVMKRKPVLDHHPEDWLGRDAIFERTDVDPLVKRALYTTMIRCVSEVVLAKGPRVLMVKAVRGFSKGYWNVPGGFMDYGEGPEAGAKREAMEEIGTEVALDGLLNVYVSGFPGKPAYTLGFVYKGHLK